MNILLISLGGALGAIARYGVMSVVGHVWGTHFPYATMVVNVLGSLFLGLTVAIIAKHLPASANQIHMFLVVGFFGAFTTFSTFSLDTVTLLKEGMIGTAVSYMALSFILGVLGLLAGLSLGRVL